MIEKTASMGIPLIISTGMVTFGEIELRRAVEGDEVRTWEMV